MARGSMPANGSSSSMKAGSLASARAISQRRRSPPESDTAGELRRWEMRSSSSRRWVVSAALRSSGSRISTTAAMFCSAVMPRKLEVSCGR